MNSTWIQVHNQQRHPHCSLVPQKKVKTHVALKDEVKGKSLKGKTAPVAVPQSLDLSNNIRSQLFSLLSHCAKTEAEKDELSRALQLAQAEREALLDKLNQRRRNEDSEKTPSVPTLIPSDSTRLGEESQTQTCQSPQRTNITTDSTEKTSDSLLESQSTLVNRLLQESQLHSLPFSHDKSHSDNQTNASFDASNTQEFLSQNHSIALSSCAPSASSKSSRRSSTSSSPSKTSSRSYRKTEKSFSYPSDWAHYYTSRRDSPVHAAPLPPLLTPRIPDVQLHADESPKTRQSSLLDPLNPPTLLENQVSSTQPPPRKLTFDANIQTDFDLPTDTQHPFQEPTAPPINLLSTLSTESLPADPSTVPQNQPTPTNPPPLSQSQAPTAPSLPQPQPFQISPQELLAHTLLNHPSLSTLSNLPLNHTPSTPPHIYIPPPPSTSTIISSLAPKDTSLLFSNDTSMIAPLPHILAEIDALPPTHHHHHRFQTPKNPDTHAPPHLGKRHTHTPLSPPPASLLFANDTSMITPLPHLLAEIDALAARRNHLDQGWMSVESEILAVRAREEGKRGDEVTRVREVVEGFRGVPGKSSLRRRDGGRRWVEGDVEDVILRMNGLL